MSGTCGLVFVDDLEAFAPWISDRGHEWATTHGAGDATFEPATVFPPPALIVVVADTSLGKVQQSLEWLRMSKRVALVVERGFKTEDYATADMRTLIADDVSVTAGALQNVVAIRDVMGGDLDAAVSEARAVLGSETEPWQAWEQPVPAGLAPAGPWIQWAPPRWSDGPPEAVDAVSHLAAGVSIRAGRPVFLDGLSGDRIDLVDGTRTPIVGLMGAAECWCPIASAPGGATWLRMRRPTGGSREPRWVLEGEAPSTAAVGGRGQVPIGIEPAGRVAWTGGRAYFWWRVLTDAGPVFWTPSDHGWPDGHAKKLYSYKNNKPLWVHVAPDASACVSVYEHDSLVTPGLPIRWRDVNGIAVAVRHRGEPRAVFFESSSAKAADWGARPTAGDEDARDAATTVCLGPNSQRRYTVGLTGNTWTVRGSEGTPLERSEHEWAVFNDKHERVHGGTGRLLAGWDRWIVVLEEGLLRRVDLVTDSVESIGPSGRPITAAVAVPGSPHVVLLSLTNEQAWLRLA